MRPPASLLPSRAPAALAGPAVRLLARLGVTPNALTFASLVGNAAAAALVASGSLAAGGLVMLLASSLDFLDGALARETGRASKAGALLDSVFDRCSEAAVLFGLLLHLLAEDRREEAALAFGALAGSLLVSYVRARAEALGVALTSGWLRRAERVALLAAALIVGALLRPVLWALAALTLLTAAQRLWIGVRALRAEAAEGG